MNRKKRRQILGDAMRKERVIRRVSQQRIADHLGLAKTTISAYELGKVSPAIDTLDEYCTFLGVNYLDLLREVTEEVRRLDI
jgi:transcriptional regulator with XRE-family HTH domain